MSQNIIRLTCFNHSKYKTCMCGSWVIQQQMADCIWPVCSHLLTPMPYTMTHEDKENILLYRYI